MSHYDNVYLMGGYDDDQDSENPIILEKCIINAEEKLWENLPEDVDFSMFITSFKKFYSAFIDAFIEKHYWKEHAKYYEYIL